ncbi:MAG TPA: hypothetical protein VEQ87_07270 [Burkholderiales bacterium]|nr:hypothetical protein [Burkholderiales bacterium]
MTRTILVAAIVALAGCASIRSFSGAPPFDPKHPQVFVVVNDKNAACADKRSFIVVDQEPIYFYRARQPQAFPIIWQLQTDGYSFVDDNNIVDPTPDPKRMGPAGEIHSCHAGKKNMQCTNKAQNSGTWKYTLRVKADDGCGSPPELDPTIAND